MAQKWVRSYVSLQRRRAGCDDRVTSDVGAVCFMGAKLSKFAQAQGWL